MILLHPLLLVLNLILQIISIGDSFLEHFSFIVFSNLCGSSPRLTAIYISVLIAIVADLIMESFKYLLFPSLSCCFFPIMIDFESVSSESRCKLVLVIILKLCFPHFLIIIFLQEYLFFHQSILRLYSIKTFLCVSLSKRVSLRRKETDILLVKKVLQMLFLFACFVLVVKVRDVFIDHLRFLVLKHLSFILHRLRTKAPFWLIVF